jgi:RND family efflux transporter MFP subunit
VDDRSSLLDQLRLERPASEPTSGRSWVWWLSGAVAVTALGAAGWLYGVPRGVPVQVAIAEEAPSEQAAAVGSILDASGYVVARRQATVSSKITGRVVEVAIEEGQRVEPGQIIARLDDEKARAAVAQYAAQVEQAEAKLTAARVELANATPTFHRNELQFQRAFISAQDFDAAKAKYDTAKSDLAVASSAVDVAKASLAVAQRDLDDTVVRAPFAGVVTVKAAQEGEMVSPVSAGGGFTRTGIGTIVDMSSLEVEVDVSENFINRVRAGQPVTIKLNAYPDWDIAGHVIAIIPAADRAKATVKVRVAFDATDARILPEMGVRVAFLNDRQEHTGDAGAPSTRSAVLVPADAVRADGDTGVVFVVADNGLEKRTVRLGARTSAGQVILSGLQSGAQVAIGDLSKLTDGARVRIEQ